MGELPLLMMRIVTWVFALVVVGMGVTAAQPIEVSFLDLDSLRVWPGQDIQIQAEWSDTASAALCVITNLSTGDAITKNLSVSDSTTAELTLHWRTGWTLGVEALGDTLLQAFYGNVLEASVLGVADTARIGVETARISVSPDSMSVGTVVQVAMADRDRNIDVSQADTVWIAWSSAFTSSAGQFMLTETGFSTGSFAGSAPVACSLDLDPPEGALLVLDADTLRFSVWDTLASASGWSSPEGRFVVVDHAIATRTATLAVIHPEYGEVAFLPMDGDSIGLSLLERDLAGVGSLAATVMIRAPDGAVRDSLSVTLAESDQSSFAGFFVIGAGEEGDSVIARYQDRADAEGEPLVVSSGAILGARLVSGTVSDSVWVPGVPVVLVDTVTVAVGHHLRVAPGVVVAAVPNRGVTWRIEGEVDLGIGGADTVFVRSAAVGNAPGDWIGITVVGTLRAAEAVVTDGLAGITALPGAVVDLTNARFYNCGVSAPTDLAVWREARGSRALARMAEGASNLPAAVVLMGCTSRIDHTTFEHNAGFGVVMTEGDCTLTGSTIAENALDGLLSVAGVCTAESTDFVRNGQGGIYVSESVITLAHATLVENELQGLYAVGGSADITGCDLRGNRGGGFMGRDGNRSTLYASLVAQNHAFGLDEAWDCTVDIDSTTVVGNGGSGLVVDYDSNAQVSGSSLAFNRLYDVLVGPWCVGDTLDARECWWGTAVVPLDSTGANCELIWDGIDSPGRTIVQFDPWRTSPVPRPAPAELEQSGGEELVFTAGGGGPGDTLWLELTPPSSSSARYAAVAVGSHLDTLVCVLLSASPIGGGPLTGRVALTAVVDLFAPDRLAAGTADQITAWWLADSTVRADLTLPVAPPDPASPLVMLSAHPNPFSSSLRLTWSTPSPVVELSLYDLAGRRQWRRRECGCSGITIVDPRAIASLPNGVYVTILQSGGQRSIVRVIRLR